MASWSKYQDDFNALPFQERGVWMDQTLKQSIKDIAALCEGRNVIFYGSSFLQKPQIPPFNYIITSEDINGFMSVIHGMDASKGLTLVLHTPGGVTNAAESVVDYLRTKFPYIEVIVPTYAMSAGTMISLASNKVILGRQSQLGPIDPQIAVNGKYFAAQAIVDQFKDASDEILANQSASAVWFPILQSLGPAVLREAQNEIAYSETMVTKWLTNYMFAGTPSAPATASAIASYFNGSHNKSHGRRIDIKEAAKVGVIVEELEKNPPLQDAVLSAYHIMTILMTTSPTTKIIINQNDSAWIKQYLTPEEIANAQASKVNPNRAPASAPVTPASAPSSPIIANRASRRKKK